MANGGGESAASKAFERVLGSLHEPSWTRSELERRFLDMCTDGGLPSPIVNAAVEGMEVDFHWPAHGLVVEIDGFEYHRTRAAFERDRERDLALQLAGLRVVRLTARTIDRGAARLASLLSRPARPAARPAG